MAATKGETGSGKVSKNVLCSTWKKRYERPNIGGVSTRSRNGAPSRKRYVVNGQMTNASNNRVRPPTPPVAGGGGGCLRSPVFNDTISPPTVLRTWCRLSDSTL